MTLDEILTEYEGLWRQAALEGRTQFPNFSGPTYGGCAWEVPMHLGRPWLVLGTYLLTWACPECDERRYSFSEVLFHLNDTHRWDWLTLANKTRDVLQQGGVTLVTERA